MATNNPDSSENRSELRAEPAQGARFVEKMLSGFGHEAQLKSTAEPAGMRNPFRALGQKKAQAAIEYHLPASHGGSRVHAGSPATEVMTDLTRIEPVTIHATATVDDANRVMIQHRVRSLFVVGNDQTIVGVITATDVLGERPIQVAQEGELRHSEVLVQQVMTPSSQLEAIDLHDVLRARVGDIVETLKHAGRQHALVVETVAGSASAARTVRGIFSLTQIARQLGLPAHVGRVARTFAEIEAAIAN